MVISSVSIADPQWTRIKNPRKLTNHHTQSDHVEVKVGLGRTIVGTKTGVNRIFHNIVAYPEGLARAILGDLNWSRKYYE